MKADQMKKLFALLNRLEEAGISFQMTRHRGDAVSLEAYAPGEHWEIDFLDDGTIDVERFRSNGKVEGETAIEHLFALCADDDKPASAGLAVTPEAVEQPVRQGA